MGASISRLQRSGGDVNAARASLDADYTAGKFSPAQRALYENPATRDAFYQKYTNQTTKGKYSGVLGKAVKLVSKAAPLAALIPGVGVPAAAAIGAAGRLAGGGGVKGAVIGGLEGGAGAALLGGEGYKGLGGVVDRAKDLIGGKVATEGANVGKRVGGLVGSGGLLSKASKGVGGPLNLASLGLAGANAIQSAQAGGRANQALDRALSALPTQAPPQREDLSSLFADPANPYSGGMPPKRAARSAAAALAGGY